jgi:hypothetical protein
MLRTSPAVGALGSSTGSHFRLLPGQREGTRKQVAGPELLPRWMIGYQSLGDWAPGSSEGGYRGPARRYGGAQSPPDLAALEP